MLYYEDDDDEIEFFGDELPYNNSTQRNRVTISRIVIGGAKYMSKDFFVGVATTLAVFLTYNLVFNRKEKN